MVPAEDAPYNAGDALLQAVAARGARALLRCAGQTLSGDDLAGRARAVQAELGRQGMVAGGRVLLVLRDTPAFPAAFIGALRAGVLPIPISTLHPPKDVAFIARDAGVTLALADAEVEPLLGGCPDLPRVLARAGDFALPAAELPAAPTRARDAAFLLYTSGTTGEPKGVVHRHLDLPVTAESYARPVLALGDRDRVLSAAKLFFAYGLGNGLTFPFLLGAQVVLCPDRPTPAAIFALLQGEEPTVFFGVPTLYAAMLADPEAPGRLPGLRLCVSAGEALPAALAGRWREKYGVEILDGLGSTEMLHIFLSNRVGASRPGSSGTPVPGYRVRIVDEQDHDVPEGETGSLLAFGASAARAYHARPEASARVMLAPGWLRTGDSYRRDSDGFYWHVGRSDDLIKVSGQFVSPVEVEAVLLAHEAVVEAAVVGETDAFNLTKARAFVVLRATARASEDLARELTEFVKARLAPHKYPRRIDFVDELPKTATGKIRRHVLREKTPR